ncbi:MAG: hypothetical protein ABIG64_02455 [Candidatus Omnitrophota bacterium]
MKIFFKITKSLLLLVLGLFLCGFEAGVQIGDPEESEELANTPVVNYEETVTAVKSDLELYQQYYVIIVSSLEEASLTLTDNNQWAYRMADNAYRYMTLLEKFIETEKKSEFYRLKDTIKPIVAKLKNGNISVKETLEIQTSINAVVKMIKSNFHRKNIDQVKE